MVKEKDLEQNESNHQESINCQNESYNEYDLFPFDYSYDSFEIEQWNNSDYQSAQSNQDSYQSNDNNFSSQQTNYTYSYTQNTGSNVESHSSTNTNVRDYYLDTSSSCDVSQQQPRAESTSQNEESSQKSSNSKLIEQITNKQKERNSKIMWTKLQKYNSLSQKEKDAVRNPPKWNSIFDDNLAFVIIIACIGITNVTYLILREIWFFNLDLDKPGYKYSKEKLQEHIQKYKRLLKEQYKEALNVDYVQLQNNMCLLKKNKYSKIVDPIYQKWNDPNFEGITNYEEIRELIRYYMQKCSK